VTGGAPFLLLKVKGSPAPTI